MEYYHCSKQTMMQPPEKASMHPNCQVHQNLDLDLDLDLGQTLP
jgi:hypothetical protein